MPDDAARTLAIASRVLERSLPDMTLPQLRVLSLVVRAPARASQLASESAISRPSLTGVLDGLVDRGWVERTEVAGDRRGTALEATAAGRRALQEARATVVATLEDILAPVAPAQREAVITGLVALGDALDAHLRRRAGRVGAGTEPRR